MAKNLFLSWLTEKKNTFFWRTPIASEKLDDALSNSEFQASIVGSRDNIQSYAHIERVIAKDYASLIEIRLRQVFLTLPLSDFKNPEGFENKDKRSPEQVKYYYIRDYLENFVKQDLRKSTSPDMQLNALRRWIDISNQLLKRHCYEGFLMVFANVANHGKDHLINGLPACYRDAYNHFLTLATPINNQSGFRNHIAKNKHDDDLYPLFLWFKDINALNISINDLRDQQKSLKDKAKELHGLAVSFEPTPSKMRKLQSDKRCIMRELRTVERKLYEQEVQVNNILEDVKKAKKYKVRHTTDNLRLLEQEIQCRYELVKDKPPSTPTSARNSPTPTLFTNQLLPSFWTRRGESAEKFWENLYKFKVCG